MHQIGSDRFFKKAKKSHIYVTGFLVGEKQNNAT